jgi:hypothetical protein
MAISPMVDCNTLNDKLFKKMSNHRVVDKDGNVFIPWHRWHVIANRVIDYGFIQTDSFTYWSNDVSLTKNGAEPKVVELPIEIARLACSKIISKEEFNNVVAMIKSEDKENLALAIEVIKGFRKIRLKQGKKSR